MNNEDEKFDLNPLRLYMENTLLKEDLENLKVSHQELIDMVKKLSDEKIKYLSQISNLEYIIERTKTELGLAHLDLNNLNILNRKIGELKDIKKEAAFTEAQFSQLIKEKDYVYVTQFDKLLWGDNYPALKVLFRYLQQMNTLSVNWSYFASVMDYGNMKPINLNTYVLAKQDLGYLLAKIKPFFLDEFTGKPSRYHAIIERKFTIDGNSLDRSFFKKYLRQYNSGKLPDNLKMKEIDKLVIDIADKYH